MMRDVYAGIAHTEYEYKYHIALSNKYRWPRTRNMYDDIVKWKRFSITAPLWVESAGDRWALFTTDQ